MRRIFLAINIPSENKKNLTDLQDELAQYLPNIRWIKPENIHLTLVFLGYIEPEKIQKVCQITKKAAEGIEPFSLNLKGLGVFPEPRRARIIWVGVYGDSFLKLLNQALFRKLDAAGFVLDLRDFTPHITIGRASDKKPNKETIFFVLNKFKETDFGHVKINSIEVMESQLKRTGPEYNVIEKIEFEE